MNVRNHQLFLFLENYLQSRVTGSRLERIRLPQAPELSLFLINADYPRGRLSREQTLRLMDNPPYWCFCWASGQVLARFLLNHPEMVKNKTVVDFGAGSGVVGIAAKLAGAGRVILCDQDERALRAGELNALINRVHLDFSSSLEALLKEDVRNWVITVADVFYDRENLPLLQTMVNRFGSVLVSDSRLKGRTLSGMDIIETRESHTVPDLDESREFNRVTLYRSR